MYLNVVSLKNGKTLAFQSHIPFSVDKLEESVWSVVTDASNGQILSFKSNEVVTIANAKVNEEKKRGLTTSITEE